MRLMPELVDRLQQWFDDTLCWALDWVGLLRQRMGHKGTIQKAFESQISWCQATEAMDPKDIALTPETLARLVEYALEERRISKPSLILTYRSWIVLRTYGLANFTNEDLVRAINLEGPEATVYGYRVKMYVDSHLGTDRGIKDEGNSNSP